MRYEELLKEVQDIIFREKQNSIEGRDRAGNLVYSKNMMTGFERFMRYDELNRLVNYSDSKGKMFSREYEPNGTIAISLNQA